MDLKTARPISTTHPEAQPLVNKEGRDAREAREAAHKFEVMLTLQMVHEMTNTMDGQSLLGSGLESRMFGSVVEWELADHISKTARLGIADDLLKQISPQEAVNDPQTAR